MTGSNVIEDYTSTLKERVWKLLDKNHELKPKDICTLLKILYEEHGQSVANTKTQWKSNFRNRQALKCLSFHNTRGWVYVLKRVDRAVAVEVGGWVQTKAKNRMLLWKDVKFGRLEWFATGRVNIWIKRPATWGRVKQLLANAFFATNLIDDVQIFDLWANTARFKGSHLVYDTGERLPYARIEYLKEGLGVVAKIGDATHPTCLELEFTYPDWAERNEKILEQNSKVMQQNAEALKQFGEFMKDLSQPKTPERQDKSMVV